MNKDLMLKALSGRRYDDAVAALSEGWGIGPAGDPFQVGAFLDIERTWLRPSDDWQVVCEVEDALNSELYVFEVNDQIAGPESRIRDEDELGLLERNLEELPYKIEAKRRSLS